MNIIDLEASIEDLGTLSGAITVPNRLGDITVNGTYDYNELVNKPCINGVELNKDSTFDFAFDWREF